MIDEREVTARQIIDILWNIKDNDARYNLKEVRPKRSRDANSYFHVLCGQLRFKADPHGAPWSMARMKNHLISTYGQEQLLMGGERMIYKTNAPEDFMREQEYLHTKLVNVKMENNREVYFYQIYRGSHTYNTWEMSKLIDGTVEECKAVGIETLTPDEIRRMTEAWHESEG